MTVLPFCCHQAVRRITVLGRGGKRISVEVNSSCDVAPVPTRGPLASARLLTLFRLAGTRRTATAARGGRGHAALRRHAASSYQTKKFTGRRSAPPCAQPGSASAAQRCSCGERPRAARSSALVCGTVMEVLGRT